MATSNGPLTLEQMKTRIITHMNADHARSLSLFQRHYNHIPASHSRTARLDDITTDHMVLKSSFGRTVVPFEPPMPALSQARARLVAMHEECLAALDESDIVVDKWIPPWSRDVGIWHLGLFVVCVITFGSFSRPSNFDPHANGYIYALYSANDRFPGFASFCRWIQPYLIAFMVVLHGAESTNLAYTRLRKHGVPLFSGLWWAWTVDCFIDGVSSFSRFDGLVRGVEKSKKLTEKH